MPSSLVMPEKKGIHWFRHDLRINDNPSFTKLNSLCSSMLCVFIIDPKWFECKQYGFSHLGQHRERFLYESLADLNEQLNGHQQSLCVLEGNPVEVLTKLVASCGIKVMSSEFHCGVYEQSQWQQLRSNIVDCHFVQENASTLYSLDESELSPQTMPSTFTPFRKKIEQIYDKKRPALVAHEMTIAKVKPTLLVDQNTLHQHNIINMPTTELLARHSTVGNCDSNELSANFNGGSKNALKQIHYYFFESDNIASYKTTRNGLDGWAFSSKLSAWLSNGSISPAQVMRELSEYEDTRVSNDSTYWLYFELLWREFFHWQMVKHKTLCFTYSGIQHKAPNSLHCDETLRKWCSGNTGFYIVDASMKQLNASGFMSNRGRQLAASCLINELQLDWRYGAAYFEQQLIDFDVASNWGNWQYLAGVGADPRGHRQFNIQKQTDLYDPKGEFIARWLPQQHSND